MTVDAPSVSIAIRAFRRRWLAEAIRSVLVQTHTDLEVVIYDDCGQLGELCAGFEDPRVRYLRAGMKLGASGRFAAAVALCRGRYIGVLDDDDRYRPTFVSELVGALERDPGAGIASCKVAYDLGGKLYDPPDRRPAGRQLGALEGLLAFRTSVPSSVMIFRAEVFAAVEAANPMPDGVAPDAYLNIEAELAGWGHALVDERLSIRRRHRSQLSATGLPALELTVSTWQRLSVGSGPLDAVRRGVLARKLIWRSIHHLANSEPERTRADLSAASEADCGRWRGLRAIVGLAAAIPPLGTPAARTVLWGVRVRQRRSPPPSLSGAGGSHSALSPLIGGRRAPPETPTS